MVFNNQQKVTQIQIHKYNIKKGYFFQFFEPNQKSILLS